jgi:hypothetical protein
MSRGLVGMYGHFRQIWGNGYLYNTDTSVLQAHHKKAERISMQDGRVTTHTLYNVIKHD